MNNVFFVFLSLSVSGSILALPLLVLRLIIKNKLSQTWQYYIWLIVILRFILPFTPQFSVVGEIARQIEDISVPIISESVDSGIVANDEYTIPQTVDMPLPSQVLPAQDTDVEIPVQSTILHDVFINIWIAWISVALALFVHKVISYRSFVRFVKSGMVKITDSHLAEIYRSELATAKIKRKLELFVNNQVASPMLVGIVYPAIVIPVLEASDDELRQIFRHEFTHYKRLDFIYKWIVQITICSHWFNPLVYLISRQINKSCELSCDETVIKRLDEDGRMTYGDALISSLNAQKNYSDFVVSLTMSENKNIVRERLDAIMNYKKKTGITLCATAFLTIMFFCGFTFTGAYAGGIVSKGTEDNAPSGVFEYDFDYDAEYKVTDNTPSGEINTMKETPHSIPANYKQITKTLDGVDIQNININADWCALIFEPASGNTFEANISYPDFLAPNYEKYFDLRMERTNNNTINISTDFDDHGFDPVEGYNFVDTSELSKLVIKFPEHYYNKVQLNLSGNQTMEFDIDTSALEVKVDVGNVMFKTNRVFNNLKIKQDVGNFDLYLRELSKTMKIDKDVGNFTLNLPSNPSGIRLTINNGDYASHDLPKTWNPSIRGNTVSYEHGNASNTVNVNHKYGVFAVNIGVISNNYYSAEDTNLKNTMPITDTGIVHTNFAETAAAKKLSARIVEIGNFFSMNRIDVVDSDGFAYQGMFFICDGSDSYKQIFYSALERLSSAYPVNDGKIIGYLDPIRDNRLRNFGDQNFASIETVAITNINGIRYDVFVIAVCGSEEFMKPYDEFYDMLWDEYRSI